MSRDTGVDEERHGVLRSAVAKAQSRNSERCQSFMSVIPTSHRDILDAPALGYMATLGPGGEPHVSPVWLLWDGMHLRFAFNKKRQKVRNLRRDARVAVALVDPANPYRALEIRGSVVRIDVDDDFTFINAASRKYLGRDATHAETGSPDDRVVLVVEPERAIAFPPSPNND